VTESINWQILAIHGAEDANAPIAGGRGTKGISAAVYSSIQHAEGLSLAEKAAQFFGLVSQSR
jgi:hypothetical protein